MVKVLIRFHRSTLPRKLTSGGLARPEKTLTTIEKVAFAAIRSRVAHNRSVILAPSQGTSKTERTERSAVEHDRILLGLLRIRSSRGYRVSFQRKDRDMGSRPGLRASSKQRQRVPSKTFIFRRPAPQVGPRSNPLCSENFENGVLR